MSSNSREAIRLYWQVRGKELEAIRAKQQGKGKGKQDPSPWAQWLDLEKAMSDIGILLQALDVQEELLQEFAAQLGESRDKHAKEIELLNRQHALNVQKLMKGH